MNGRILTPTDNYPPEVQPRNTGFSHLMPHLRIGKMSFEAFDKLRVRVIPQDHNLEETDNARKKQKATEVPVREVREGVGEKASLQPSTEKAKARKKKVTKKPKSPTSTEQEADDE